MECAGFKIMARKYSKYHVDVSKSGVEQRSSIDRKTGKKIVFDSKLEKQFYIENICGGLDDGTVIDYELQKRYQLQPSFKHNGKTIRAIDYIADFWIRYADGSECVIDAKSSGMVDPIAKLKRKIMWYLYPKLDYRWMTYTKATGWIDWDEYTEICRKKRKGRKG